MFRDDGHQPESSCCHAARRREREGRGENAWHTPHLGAVEVPKAVSRHPAPSAVSAPLAAVCITQFSSPLEPLSVPRRCSNAATSRGAFTYPESGCRVLNERKDVLSEGHEKMRRKPPVPPPTLLHRRCSGTMLPAGQAFGDGPRQSERARGTGWLDRGACGGPCPNFERHFAAFSFAFPPPLPAAAWALRRTASGAKHAEVVSAPFPPICRLTSHPPGTGVIFSPGRLRRSAVEKRQTHSSAAAWHFEASVKHNAPIHSRLRGTALHAEIGRENRPTPPMSIENPAVDRRLLRGIRCTNRSGRGDGK